MLLANSSIILPFCYPIWCSTHGVPRRSMTTPDLTCHTFVYENNLIFILSTCLPNQTHDVILSRVKRRKWKDEQIDTNVTSDSFSFTLCLLYYLIHSISRQNTQRDNLLVNKTKTRIRKVLIISRFHSPRIRGLTFLKDAKCLRTKVHVLTKYFNTYWTFVPKWHKTFYYLINGSILSDLYTTTSHFKIYDIFLIGVETNASFSLYRKNILRLVQRFIPSFGKSVR